MKKIKELKKKKKELLKLIRLFNIDDIVNEKNRDYNDIYRVINNIPNYENKIKLISKDGYELCLNQDKLKKAEISDFEVEFDFDISGDFKEGKILIEDCLDKSENAVKMTINILETQETIIQNISKDSIYYIKNLFDFSIMIVPRNYYFKEN